MGCAIVQFKKREKHPWRNATFSKVAGDDKSSSVEIVNSINSEMQCLTFQGKILELKNRHSF